MSRLFPAYFRSPLFKEPFFDDPDFFESIEYPSTDIKESDESYTVIADLPGMTKENIEITYQDNVLTIEAKHEVSTEEKDDEKK
ncbi:MAG TPA: Hsp20 family protein, partial [Trichococcus sp.]|nr:Hsp20 family protein [Trichococcus sp.]